MFHRVSIRDRQTVSGSCSKDIKELACADVISSLVKLVCLFVAPGSVRELLKLLAARCKDVCLARNMLTLKTMQMMKKKRLYFYQLKAFEHFFKILALGILAVFLLFVLWGFLLRYLSR